MPRVTEKTLEINICNEIMYFLWRRLHKRILFLGPSLLEESRRGWDVKGFAARLRPFYIQFKSGNKQAGGKVAVFEINNDTYHKQHHLLVNLSKRASVFYSLPLMFSMGEIVQNKWQLLRHTSWLNVALMPLLPPPPYDEHKVQIDLINGLYGVYSTDRTGFREISNWAEVYDHLVERTALVDSELAYNWNILAIRETVHGDELPGDMASGLVFGAIPG